MSLRCLVAAIAVSLLRSASIADGVDAKPLSLAEAQRLALERNADFLAARVQVDAALAQLRAAREFPNPTLSLSSTRINVDRRSNGTIAGNRFFDRSYDSIVSLSQLLEVGKRGPRQSSARAERRAVEAQRDDVRRLVVKAVCQAYIAALEAAEERDVLAKSSNSLHREADLAATRFAAGDIAWNDKAQLEITAVQRELDAAAAQHTATIATISLEILLGYPTPNGDTRLADSLDSFSLPQPGESSVLTRPDVVAAEAFLAKAETDLVIQKRGAIPDVTLSAQFEHSPPDSPNTMGIAFSLPLPLWNQNRGAVGLARAARNLAQSQLDKVRAEASADVASALSGYREAHRRDQAYSRELIAKSADVLKTVAYSYEHGGKALVELLAAERNDNDIRLAAARAQADAASATFTLAAAVNQIGDRTNADKPR